MTVSLNELTERVHKALVHDAYDTNDITRLIDIALRQQETIEQLASDNERLTKALEIAGKKIDELEPFSHLSQYAEENA
jgi:chromosome condensin MukBEF ATPase and DNA-binding subunit MukB